MNSKIPKQFIRQNVCNFEINTLSILRVLLLKFWRNFAKIAKNDCQWKF